MAPFLFMFFCLCCRSWFLRLIKRAEENNSIVEDGDDEDDDELDELIRHAERKLSQTSDFIDRRELSMTIRFERLWMHTLQHYTVPLE